MQSMFLVQPGYVLIAGEISRSSITSGHKQHILNGEFAGGFTLALMAKDVKIAADLGESVGLDAPMSRLVRDRFAAARDEVGADKDNSAAILAWDKDRG